MGRKHSEDSHHRSKKAKATEASAVPVTLATPAGKVVQLPKPSVEDRKLSEFYAKYPHVMVDSVREPTAADLKNLSHCHGKVCTVKCTDCGTERVINVQDAFQSARCPACRLAASKVRRAERAATREAKRSANG